MVVGASLPANRSARAQDQANFVVVFAKGASLADARRAVEAAGGMIVEVNASVGVASVASQNPDFVAAVRSQSALAGATRNLPVAQIDPSLPARADDVERLNSEGDFPRKEPIERTGGQSGADPLAGLQWDMDMIHANAAGSHAVQAGDPRVIVAVIDSGIDASHPDLAANFSHSLSRNFVTDIPSVDGPCEYPGCVDPPDVDNSGHGTHVAGTIGAALNGIGIAGIAPNITLVNARGGQDSGYVFLMPVVNALVYAGDIGADIANMSFYIDPWLFNCTSNPADSPDAQLEQQTVIEATQRAVDYARGHGVTLFVSAGNGHTDMGHPASDATSPDFPPGSEYLRTVDNSCLVMPSEANGILSVSALGPTKIKADYSDYGFEHVDLSAPGGYFRDYFGDPRYRTNENLVLSSYPRSVLEADGLLAPDGTPLTSSVIRDCVGSTCAYYAYLQGTSMASPHAAGVGALIVSKYGRWDPNHPGTLMLQPVKTEKIIKYTATDTACPDPRLFSYANVGRPPSFNAYCEGTAQFNGFYGEGIVDALKALSVPNNMP